jgi:hypothetical protein
LAKRSGLFPRSRSTLRVRELRDCAADLTAIEGANDKGVLKSEGTRSHDPVIGYRFAGQLN